MGLVKITSRASNYIANDIVRPRASPASTKLLGLSLVLATILTIVSILLHNYENLYISLLVTGYSGGRRRRRMEFYARVSW